MTLEELKRFAEAAMAFDPYDDAQIERIIRIFHDTTPKLLEMIAVLREGHSCIAGTNYSDRNGHWMRAQARAALGHAAELERSL